MTARPTTEDACAEAVRSAINSVVPGADLGSLGPDEDIVESLELDSMDVLNVMAAVAEQTGLEVPERHYPRTRTLQGFVGELMELGQAR